LNRSDAGDAKHGAFFERGQPLVVDAGFEQAVSRLQQQYLVALGLALIDQQRVDLNQLCVITLFENVAGGHYHGVGRHGAAQLGSQRRGTRD